MANTGWTGWRAVFRSNGWQDGRRTILFPLVSLIAALGHVQFTYAVFHYFKLSKRQCKQNWVRHGTGHFKARRIHFSIRIPYSASKQRYWHGKVRYWHRYDEYFVKEKPSRGGGRKCYMLCSPSPPMSYSLLDQYRTSMRSLLLVGFYLSLSFKHFLNDTGNGTVPAIDAIN